MQDSIDTANAAALSVCQAYCSLQLPLLPTMSTLMPEQHLQPNPASASVQASQMMWQDELICLGPWHLAWDLPSCHLGHARTSP